MGFTVTEQLAQLFLMIGNVILFHQPDEILRQVTAQGRQAEARVIRQEILRSRVQIGEVTSPAAGNTNFPRHGLILFNHKDTAASLAALYGAHKASGPGPDNYRIKICHGIVNTAGGPVWQSRHGPQIIFEDFTHFVARHLINEMKHPGMFIAAQPVAEPVPYGFFA